MKFSEAYDRVFPHEEKKDDPETTPMVSQTESEGQDGADGADSHDGEE
nr:MAG TPA: hypothetical protein [Caudoviricetes sp.]